MVLYDSIRIESVQDFYLQHIFECGQTFRYYKLNENDYVTVAFGKVIRLIQQGQCLQIENTTIEEWERVWKHYFDLDTDYASIKAYLSQKDSYLKAAIELKWGTRLLRQEPLETLLTFIISQNKNIPHIIQIIDRIATQYGTYLGEAWGKKFYAFPTLEILQQLTVEDFRQLKCGFRAPYLVDAIQHISHKPNYFESMELLDTLSAKQQLMKIKGVGEKVAECTLLFGCGRREVYPVDVWVKRLSEDYYLHQESKPDMIRQFAATYFGQYAGYAQQYLFYAYRDQRKS